MVDELICDVCRKLPALGVASSQVGPISHAYCKDCAHAGREPWSTLVGGLMGVPGPEAVAERLKPVIRATCEFFQLPESALWDDVRKADEEYRWYRIKQQEKEQRSGLA